MTGSVSDVPVVGRLAAAVVPARVSSFDRLRALALLATLVLLASFGSVLAHIADVAGVSDTYLLLVAASLLGATLLARYLGEWTALALGVGLLAVGLVWYLLSLSYVPSVGPIVDSNLALVTGQSVNQIRQSGIWVLGVTPTPLFVTWYLALRRHYGVAALVGGGMLGYFVLTGDAGWPTTLLGVVGVAGMLGFGDFDRRGATSAGVEQVAFVLAVMVVVPLVVSVAPAGTASPISVGDTGGDGSTTLENSLLDDGAEITLDDSANLSPAVRFTVESPIERYWKATSYDRYTGNGWVRTGSSVPLDAANMQFPPGPRRTVRQTIEVESRLTTVPAAWRPVAVDGAGSDRVRASESGALLADRPLQSGDVYSVTSAVGTDLGPLLERAGSDYPDRIRERYTRLPESTSDRVRERTDTITGDADSPYETAVRVEQWLEDNRGYSLTVDRPEGDVAEAFLFEMEDGYCTYFATTMAVMLRSEGVPARVATGYAPGQQVAEDRWVVRGLDAHAWVEVYVPDLGWVAFDPTPADPRQEAEGEQIEAAREAGAQGVDTGESRDETPASPEDETGGPADEAETTPDQDLPLPAETGPNVSVPRAEPITTAPPTDSPWPDLPPREHLALGVVLLAGAVAGVRRTGLARWLARTATVVWQPRTDPDTDAERAFRRIGILLARRYRERRPGETVRQYLAAIDAPAEARRVAAIRERARYGDGIDEDTADEAVDLADSLRRGTGAER